MKILLLDNYDSFTYNLLHIIKETDAEVDVIRNDKISLDEIAKYDKIILSPGGGIPSEAGILLDLIKQYASTKSILGICLGEQAIAETFGGKLINLDEVIHGIQTPIKIINKDYIFEGLPNIFEAGRYHSWIVDKNYLPNCLEITATDNNGDIMAIKHKKYDIRGVQFHPESILTPLGKKIIINFINH
ncbi:MAG: aminodeoxychorismate/anthranilate synthase component II [Bacteroidetes bacterium]|nr:aminodeoxychorismate/anthranilate synthase component II [Bacteroidota bacterium]